MAKLYLIRRNLETFAGPMTLSEIKEGYKRMAFGLQDEVAGSCGAWVTFDNLPALRKHYPEVARIVNEEMLAGWGVSDHGVRINQEATRKIDVKSRRGIGLALTFFAITIVAFIAAIYMANITRLSGKGRDPDIPLTPEEAQAYIDRGDAAGFDNLIQANMREIVDRTLKWKRGESPWLPYLRLWAFTNEGAVEGLPGKMLRGSLAGAAPVDCSLRAWRRNWRASMTAWNELLAGHQLPRSHWARVLAWDPHWIRRREHRGWLGGLNYYIGCLTMADRALTEMTSDPSLVQRAEDWGRMGMDKVRARVQWLLQTTRDGMPAGPPQAPTVDNDLSVWTCFEGARDLKELQRCREALPAQAPESWLAYTEERHAWTAVRLAVSTRGALPADLGAVINTVAPQLPRGDFFTSLDYRAEQRLARALVKQTVPVEKALEKVVTEFPELKKAH